MTADAPQPVGQQEDRRRILLVEDEPSLILTLTDRLVSEGYAVESVTDGVEGQARAAAEPFDLIVLDRMLPGKDGLDVCRDLRQLGVETPILMLTARGQVVDRVVGLKLGADDYLTKPFDMMELLARIESLLRRVRRSGAATAGGYAFGGVRVDFGKGEVTVAGEAVDLSALEYKLLRYFVEHRGAVLSRDTLLDEVWGYDTDVYTRTVDVHVASLRQKLEPNPAKPEFIVTVWGRGYKFLG